jgi:hypothetical protein
MLVYLDLDDEGNVTVRDVHTDRALTHPIEGDDKRTYKAIRFLCERENWIVKGRVGFDDEVNPKVRIHIEMEKPVKKKGWLARIGL